MNKISYRSSSSFMLRRAFSVSNATISPTSLEGGNTTHQAETIIDIIYRIVGRCTLWMSGLTAHDHIDVLGPLGNSFTIPQDTQCALLVGGGVGVPPMLHLARRLSRVSCKCLLFVGARAGNLIPISLDTNAARTLTATHGAAVIPELSGMGVECIIATEDGSLGHHGTITDAFCRYVQHVEPLPESTRIYTCGPEPMMRRVVETCSQWNLESQVCMERAMACGVGTCQSCVVGVSDASSPEGWRYSLSCCEGPVYDGRCIRWKDS